VDGLKNVRFYGTRGQAQHGIDIVGWTDSGEAQVLQGKNVDAFGEREFAEAVAAFQQGKRPFGPTRFVVGVALPGRRTQLIEQLAQARSLLGVIVDLYDADHLDDMLRQHPEIVEEFFGREAAQRFCTGVLASGPSDAAMDHTARAFAVGPVRALGLEEEVQLAQQLEDPAEKARAFLTLADQLEEGHWEPHARAYRRLARGLFVEAVRAGGDPATATELADLSMAEAVEALLAGDARFAASASQTIAGLSGLQPWPVLAPGVESKSPPLADRPEWKLRASALFASGASLREPFPGLSGALNQARELVSQLVAADDSSALPLGTIVGELAVAAEDASFSSETMEALGSAAWQMLRAPERQHRLGARLACVLAEMRGDWTELVAAARRSEFEPGAAALIMARYARSCALATDDDQAIASWYEAIRWAGEVTLATEAANWMRCIINTRLRLGLFGEDQDLLSTAAALDEMPARDRLLPDVEDEWREALGALSENPPDVRDALEPLVRIRWFYLTLGDLRQENQALMKLAVLLEGAGEFDRALEILVRASASKEAQQLLERSPDRPVHVVHSRGRPLRSQKIVLYRVVSDGGDLIPDDEALKIGMSAAEDALGIVDGSVADTGFAPTLLSSAVEAVAAVADRVPESLLKRLIDALESTLERPKGQFFQTDDGFFRILCDVASRQDLPLEFRTRSARLLAKASIAMPHAKGNPADVLQLAEDAPELASAIEEVLLPLVADDSPLAAVILRDYPSVREHVRAQAESALTRLLTPQPANQDSIGIGVNYGPDAWLIGSLDEDSRIAAIDELIERAARPDDVLVNRESALLAVPGLLVTLDPEVRSGFFDELMPFGRGERDVVTLAIPIGQQHPLSMFQFNMGPSTLAPAGLRAAAICALDDASQNEVAKLAIEGLRRSTGHELHSLVTALASLPAALLEAYVPLLARDGRDDLRALAAVCWTQHPTDVAVGNALAEDAGSVVRRTLASNLSRAALSAEHDDPRWSLWVEPLSLLSHDIRASVRRKADVALLTAPRSQSR
jgi:hypothetical protein